MLINFGVDSGIDYIKLVVIDGGFTNLNSNAVIGTEYVSAVQTDGNAVFIPNYGNIPAEGIPTANYEVLFSDDGGTTYQEYTPLSEIVIIADDFATIHSNLSQALEDIKGESYDDTTIMDIKGSLDSKLDTTTFNSAIGNPTATLEDLENSVTAITPDVSSDTVDVVQVYDGEENLTVRLTNKETVGIWQIKYAIVADEGDPALTSFVSSNQNSIRIGKPPADDIVYSSGTANEAFMYYQVRFKTIGGSTTAWSTKQSVVINEPKLTIEGLLAQLWADENKKQDIIDGVSNRVMIEVIAKQTE